MKVEIASKEIIKPSSSTPHHLRNYKLSLHDQLAPPVYVPILLFYSSDPAPKDSDPTKRSQHLKQSFSQALTHFYPLAGRIQDDLFSVDCNDEGASYSEAFVDGPMSEIMVQEPDIDQLEMLLPCNPREVSQVILETRVNYFDCGGISIGVCIWHGVADALSVASFVTAWAEIASKGCWNEGDGVIYDCTSIFPPQDMGSYSLHRFLRKEELSNTLIKRFVFDGCKIIALREEVSKSGSWVDNPTRFEAVSALIWGALAEFDEANRVGISVSLRTRMDPSLPKKSIGNIVQMTFAEYPVEDGELQGYNRLAGKLHESIKMMSNDYIRKMHAGGAYFEFVKALVAELGKNKKTDDAKFFGFTSWCRFPFYEADFGWGKPTWVGNAMKLNKSVVYLDTKDGQGIEAWVGLPREIMAKFEQNPGICAYASFIPSEHK